MESNKVLNGLDKLKTIGESSFRGKGISSINFNELQNINEIREGAFSINKLTILPVLPPSISKILLQIF